MIPDSPMSVAADPTRDWPEDFAHENGQYQRTCIFCKEDFVGHKRRVTCKKCAEQAIEHALSSAPAADRPVENSELRHALVVLDRECQRLYGEDTVGRSLEEYREQKDRVVAIESSVRELFAYRHEKYMEIVEELRDAEAEISRLRADRLACPICGADPAIGAHTSDCPNRDIALDIDSHLTPEEARHLGGLSVSIRKSAADGCGICQRINAKLSRISGSGSQ